VRKVTKTVKVELLPYWELPFEDQELIAIAIRARRNAQVHLSHYAVGAAIRSESGKFYYGCNVERSTYTQTTHAEQNAVDSMIAEEGSAKIVAMAIVSAPEGEKIEIPINPEAKDGCKVGDFCFACGHCLQIVWENCMVDPKVRLLLLTPWGEAARTTMGHAFPMPFGPESLGIDVRS